ncbi:hypothetical protein JMM61_20930, partial [Rhodovulum sulfidophilum]|uniref:DUF7146 domain-containing protein n=1 Tax=Rhodovulum sulfidophilum TaxID=35806 RepID=UPI001A52A6A6|nr:hypothetical protein [Rhodovulum sulfidophilum]
REIHRGPAMVALVQAPGGRGSGIHRTWLDLDQPKGKAVIAHDAPAADPETARWGPWQSFDAADFSGRAFRFRAVLSVESPDYTIGITGLTVTALQAA